MLKIFTLITLSCFCLILISCKKDSTNGANPGGTSTYTLLGAPGGCTAPVVTGTYGVGTALTAANTITLSVDVALNGTYAIGTTSVNGVRFTGTGVFATTGVQTIVLTASGTPQRSGIFYFVPNTNNTCNFPVSFGAGGPPAVYTYAGAPANCTAPTITGTYTTGVSLGSNNYVDLAVNVTTPGAYTVTTNTLNGIRFSGSGAFTATGAQVIRLIGNGMPAASGPFVYTPANNGCSFTITVNPPAPPATYTFNGAPGSCTTPAINGTYAAGTALNGTNTIVLGVNVTVIGSYNVTTNGQNAVVFSGSGNFTMLGLNSITLTSTSTPAGAGPFTYTPTNNGCSFDITYTSGPPPPADFLRCTIDGVAKDFSTNLTANLSPGSFLASGESGISSFQINVTDVNGAAITPGSYNKFSITNQSRFCIAQYLPNSGSPMNAWIPGLINNNPFTVTIQTITATKVTGTFAGDLFDLNGANKKIVTNGTFSVTY